MYVQWKWNKVHFTTNINIKDTFINEVWIPKSKTYTSSLNLEPTNIHFPIFADRVEWLGWASRLWDLISNDSPSGWLVRMCLQYLRPEEWHLQWQSVSVVRHPNTSHTHSSHWIDSQQRIETTTTTNRSIYKRNTSRNKPINQPKHVQYKQEKKINPELKWWMDSLFK